MAKKTARLAHGVAVSALFSAMSLLYGSAAYGSFYPGHIDPGGNGSDIPGFNGNLIFNIDPNCTTGTGFHSTFAASGSCGAASVYSADISLYTTSPTDPPSPGTVLDSFQTGTQFPGTLPLSTFDIFGVETVNGHITGVDTGFMGPVQTAGFYASDTFWLFLRITPVDTIGGDPAYLAVNSEQNLSGPGTEVFGPACKTDANGAPINCVVGTVPEPGTLSLILGALGGGWLARRRKQKAAAAS